LNGEVIIHDLSDERGALRLLWQSIASKWENHGEKLEFIAKVKVIEHVRLK
jgi:hypothetical protein